MTHFIEINDGMDRSYGSLHDCGGADSYYGREPRPHFWKYGGNEGVMVTDLNKAQIAEYMQGYNENERNGFKKEY